MSAVKSLDEKVTNTIKAFGPLTVKSIAKRLGEKPVNVHRAIARLPKGTVRVDGKAQELRRGPKAKLFVVAQTT